MRSDPSLALDPRPLVQCLLPKGDKHEGHLAVVRLLAAAGADLSHEGAYQGLAALRLSAVAGSRPLTRLLVDLGAPVDAFAAAMIGDTEALASMLAARPGLVSEIDSKGRAPLHCVGMSRLWRGGPGEVALILQTARLLLDAGSDIDAPTDKPGASFGPTPLWWAISSGRCEALALFLLSEGADPRAAMAAAAYQGRTALMEALLAHGASVDELSNKGCTPLHDCLLFTRPAAVPWLLEHGADPDLRTPEGHTALQLAIITKQAPEIIASLEALSTTPG